MYNKKLFLIGILSVVILVGGYFFIRQEIKQDKTAVSKEQLSSDYKEKNGKYSFKVPSGFKVQEKDGYTSIFKEEHRQLKDSDTKYGEIPYPEISIKIVKNLPTNEDPTLPQMPVNKIKIGDREVTTVSIVPGQFPNKYYYVELKEGFLELGIDPIWEPSSINDDLKLINTSKELDQGIKEIIKSLEVK